MKKQNVQDERISAQRRKINSEAYGLFMLLLLASILLQQFVLDAPFKQYAAEFFCFFGMSVYIIVRYLMLGLNLFGEGKGAKFIPLLSSIVTGLTVTGINGVINYSRYATHYQADGLGYFIATLAVTFISSTALTFVLLTCLNVLNKKKQARIQKQLDEEEQNE